ncbi:MAG TPA: NUDIX domain-containing protein, partial [Thermomicrobiales bacterium]|nr:NUDIX domain-containing protein [Thermomicrobiales bacterium]
MTKHATAPWYIVNVEVAIFRNGRYLAITRSAAEEFGAGDVSFPGGKVDLQIPAVGVLEATARREVLEETGLILSDAIVYVESHTFGTLESPVLDVVMLAHTAEGAIVAAPDEVERAEWLTFDDMQSHPLVQP